MKGITRHRIRVNRIATCWLIRSFVDSAAEFLFVPARRRPLRWKSETQRKNNGNCMPQ